MWQYMQAPRQCVSMSNISFHASCFVFCLLAKIQGLLIFSGDSWWHVPIVFWRFFFSCVLSTCKQTEAELKEDSRSPTLKFQCVYPFYSSNICLPYFTRQKRICSFLPHSKPFADRLETLCAQLCRPNQFPNKSVTKDNLIDLRVCLSSRRCLQSQEGDGRAGRRSNEHLIHHSGRDAPTGPL